MAANLRVGPGHSSRCRSRENSLVSDSPAVYSIAAPLAGDFLVFSAAGSHGLGS